MDDPFKKREAPVRWRTVLLLLRMHAYTHARTHASAGPRAVSSAVCFVSPRVASLWQDGEVTMKRTRRKQVALKVSHVRHDPAHLARPQHRISHTFTDSVLAFGPMTKQPERFPKDSSLDEFGKSRVMLATEVAAVPSDFAAGSASQRLTKAFGPPRVRLSVGVVAVNMAAAATHRHTHTSLDCMHTVQRVWLSGGG